MLASTKEIDMEITILMLVAITFVAGIVGGLVIADATDTHENRRRQRREARSKKREERRQAANRRMDKMRKMPTFTIDKF
jgi:hypothetical protein